MVREEDSILWMRARMDEAGRIVPALAALYTQDLARAWGEPGEPGDPIEIKHLCKLIQTAADQLLRWEEDVRFVTVDSKYSRLFSCLPGVAGRQLDTLRGIPGNLDEAVDWAEMNPGGSRTFHFKLVFDLPDRWSDRIDRELKRINRGWRWF